MTGEEAAVIAAKVREHLAEAQRLAHMLNMCGGWRTYLVFQGANTSEERHAIVHLKRATIMRDVPPPPTEYL